MSEQHDEKTGSLHTFAFCARKRSSGSFLPRECGAHMTQASYAPPLAELKPLA